MAQVMTRGMVKSKLIIYVMATKAFHKTYRPSFLPSLTLLGRMDGWMDGWMDEWGLIVMNIDKWVIRSQAPIINGVQFID